VKVVILWGGSGTRLREETEFRPNTMAAVGGHPILRHHMKFYAHQIGGHISAAFDTYRGYQQFNDPWSRRAAPWKLRVGVTELPRLAAKTRSQDIGVSSL
jgi:molybdopterin-guanine dinucleotide biosynthesis protein A